ncbi:MAG: transcriptional repressor LexA [Anaplasmataceae bacterium]|nr:transcriptional repressor LexA [Anaplasmataceae bacterium]
MTAKKLTAKQKQFYDALKDLMDRKGESPTVAELVKLMRFSSPRAVTQYLDALEKKGMIERGRYEKRGIRLTDYLNSEPTTVNIPVIASAGCDNLNIFAEKNLGDYICVATELLQGVNKDNVVCVKAVGDSMVDAGIEEGDYVLVEVTENVNHDDLVVAIIDSFAVIKKIEFANNAIILKPVSQDPQYKPIIVGKNFRLFGKVIDVIRLQPKGELEIVPLYNPGPDGPHLNYEFI